MYRALNDAREVSQVEEVVRLGGGGQQTDHGRLVDGEGGVDDRIDHSLEVARESPKKQSPPCNTMFKYGWV